MSSAGKQIEIVKHPERQDYEITVGGEVAGLMTYEERGDRIAIMHTEVSDRYEGQGLASRLAAFALDDIRQLGQTVVPVCPYLTSYLRRHPEYADLVAHR
jgi:predicted GNAT family acetyltransferase